MKACLFVFSFIFILSFYSFGAKYYASPDGSDTNTGKSPSSPFSLVYATGTSSPLVPGDSLLMLDGVYGGNFTFSLNGAPANPIYIVAANPGKAIVDVSKNRTGETAITLRGNYIWLVGVHVTSSTVIRNSDPSNGFANVLYESGIAVFGNYNKIINCWVYDVVGVGLELWRSGLDLEVYGCVVFNNGSQTESQGRGHGMYIQHDQPQEPKIIENNFVFQNAARGINIYTTNPKNGGVVVRKNTSFNTGASSSFDQTFLRPFHNLVIGSGFNESFEMTVDSNIFYSDLQGGRLTPDLINNVALGRNNPIVRDLRFRENIIFGGGNMVELKPITNLTFQGNKLYNAHGNFIATNGTSATSFPNSFWDQNIYRNIAKKSRPFQELDFTGWLRDYSPIDKASQYSELPASNQEVLVTQNKYDPSRFHVTILNLSGTEYATVDFSGFAASFNDVEYEIIDIQNPFDSNQRVNGTFKGGSISFPMNWTKSLQPKGNLPFQVVHTDKTFGTFLLVFKGTGNSTPSFPEVKSSVTLQLNSDGLTTLKPDDFLSERPKDSFTYSSSKGFDFDCSDLGVNEVSLTLENTGTGQKKVVPIQVRVVDSLSPVFDASDATVVFDPVIGKLTLSISDFPMTNLRDNCSGNFTFSLSKTEISCGEIFSGQNSPKLDFPITITVKDASGNASTKNVKVVVGNIIESKKVSLKSSGTLTDGKTVTLTLGDELEYEVAYWKRMGSSGMETLPSSSGKSIQVDKSGQYTAVLDLASGCQVESASVVVELTGTDWPASKENVSLSLSENGSTALVAGMVFEKWPVEGVSVAFSKSNFSCENLGKNQVSATLSHPTWGQKDISFEVSIVDDLAPILSLQSPELVLDKIIGFLEVDVQDFIFSATDNCEVSSLEISPSKITCDQLGKEIAFEITAKDPSGNQTKKQVSVTIGEFQSKSLSISAVTLAPYYVGETVELRLGGDFEFAVEGWYRNGQLLTGQKGKSILVEQSGSYFAKVFPTNGCLINSDAIQVNFQEAEFGVIRTEILLNLGPNGQAELQSSQIFETWPLPTGFTATLSQSKFTCEDLGENEVTILIKNDKGTTWERKTTVVVRDTIAPVLKGSANEAFLDVTQGNLEIDIDELITEVSDNCGIKEISPSKITLTCEDLAKTKEVKISAVDFSGNKTEIIVPLTVKRKEETAPVLEGLKEFCEGETSTLEVKADGNFEVIAWRKNGSTINGETQKILSVTESGEYQALIRYTGGCLSETETVSIQVNPLPAGEIQVDGNILRAPEGFTYQWYRNGEVMSGKTDRTLIVDSMGEYKVLLKSESGCEAFLNSVTLTISGIALPWTSQAAQLKIYPNPAKDFATLEFVDEPTPNLDALKIYTATGADITDLVQISSLESGKLELRFSGIVSGTYLLTWIESGKKAHFGRLIILK